MNMVKAQLMGQREKLKMDDMKITVAAKAHADAIKEKLAGSSVTPLEKIDTGAILFHASELHTLTENHRKHLTDIDKLNEEID